MSNPMTMAANLTPIPELYVSYESAQKLKADAGDLISHDLTPRQICDLELLMNGGFNPLKGFLSQDDYNSVVDTMRLADGTLWPMPITLDVAEDYAESLEIGQDIALRDQEGVNLATMTVTDRWTPDKAHEAKQVFGADDSGTLPLTIFITLQARFIWAVPSRAFSSQFTMISKHGATPQMKCAPIFASLGGAKWSLFKRATHCTAPTKN
jgi:hypothetical protein